jgi:hypothetical protein
MFSSGSYEVVREVVVIFRLSTRVSTRRPPDCHKRLSVMLWLWRRISKRDCHEIATTFVMLWL